jgi:hypothetical protein
MDLFTATNETLNTRHYRIEAYVYGHWTLEAVCNTRRLANRYVTNSKFWDGMRRRIILQKGSDRG